MLTGVILLIFIYNCYGGTHSSSLCSWVHLGHLPLDRTPTKKEIVDTPYFDRLKYKDMGKILYRGTDMWGNKVYTLGRGTSKVLLPALNNLMEILKTECSFKDEVVFINASPTVPLLMTIGGFLSRGLKIHVLGRPLLVKGAQQTYPNIIKLVKDTLESHGFNFEDIKMAQKNK